MQEILAVSTNRVYSACIRFVSVTRCYLIAMNQINEMPDNCSSVQISIKESFA